LVAAKARRAGVLNGHQPIAFQAVGLRLKEQDYSVPKRFPSCDSIEMRQLLQDLIPLVSRVDEEIGVTCSTFLYQS
jgi:hypothetical protein